MSVKVSLGKMGQKQDNYPELGYKLWLHFNTSSKEEDKTFNFNFFCWFLTPQLFFIIIFLPLKDINLRNYLVHKGEYNPRAIFGTRWPIFLTQTMTQIERKCGPPHRAEVLNLRCERNHKGYANFHQYKVFNLKKIEIKL